MAESLNTRQNRNSKNPEGGSISIWMIFNSVDSIDVSMMVLGTLGSIVDGLAVAGVFAIMSGLINTLGSGTPSLKYDDFVDKMNQQIVPYLYLAAGAWIAAFLEGFCWTRTGERQASALRRKYLRAILRQDDRFFDTRGTHIAEVVNSVYNDILVIQDALGEKLPGDI